MTFLDLLGFFSWFIILYGIQRKAKYRQARRHQHEDNFTQSPT